VGVAEDIVISMVVFLFLSLRNTDGTVFQGANSSPSPRIAITWLSENLDFLIALALKAAEVSIFNLSTVQGSLRGLISTPWRESMLF
jgi:hypothetical protein